MNAFLIVYFLLALMPSVLAVTWRAWRFYSSPYMSAIACPRLSRKSGVAG